MTEPITIQAARSWTIRIPFAGEWLTANPRGTSDRYGRSRLIRRWRESAATACLAARLPKGITPVRLHVVMHYIGRPPVRDRDNIVPTVKALVDGLTPPREFQRNGKWYRTAGYGLIPDDSDRHVLAITRELVPTMFSQPWVDLIITEALDG